MIFNLCYIRKASEYECSDAFWLYWKAGAVQ